MTSGHSYLPNDASFAGVKFEAKKFLGRVVADTQDWMEIAIKSNRKHPNRVVDFQQLHHRDWGEYLKQFYVWSRDGTDGVTGNPIPIKILQYDCREYHVSVVDGTVVQHPGIIWLRHDVDGMMADPDDPAGPRVQEPWTTWDVRKYRPGGGQVPVLGPGVRDLDYVEMDIYVAAFDKYDDWLLLPAPKVKDLISHAGFLKEHKRAQYLLLAEGREDELATLDAETIAERMQLGLGLRVHE